MPTRCSGRRSRWWGMGESRLKEWPTSMAPQSGSRANEKTAAQLSVEVTGAARPYREAFGGLIGRSPAEYLATRSLISGNIFASQ